MYTYVCMHVYMYVFIYVYVSMDLMELQRIYVKVSPVLHQPVVLSVQCAITNGQHSVVHLLAAGWVIVHS